MLSAQLLSQIADTYTPLLLLLSLALCSVTPWRLACTRLVQLLLSAMLVYGLMGADKLWYGWASLGLDYSTHTAAALALVVFAGRSLGKRLAWVCLLTSLLTYGELMFYLGYHSWADMFSTAVVMVLGLWAIYRVISVPIGSKKTVN